MIAFVTDGNQRPALAIARSLGRRGIEVIVGESASRSLASSSRYCAEHVEYPSPYDDPDGFDAFLFDLVIRRHIDVLVPVTDVTTHAVARHQTELRRHSGLAVPPLASFEAAADKWRLLREAKDAGIAVPRTLYVEDADALARALPRVTYPAVVKPTRSRIRTESGWLSADVKYARTEADLRRLYERHACLAHHPSLIQERITGDGVGLFALCRRGEVLTVFSHVRIREKPPSGGVSVVSESTPVRASLRRQAERLLGSLNWHGVAMLEYKQNRMTSRAVLMEMNGRFWGSLQLAVDAGVDFPYLAHQLALGRAVDAPAAFRVGVRNHWWLGDLDHLILRLRRPGADLPDGAPSRLRCVTDFLGLTARRGRSEVLRFDDLRPALHECREYVEALRRPRARAGSPAAAPRPLPAEPAAAAIDQNRSRHVSTPAR